MSILEEFISYLNEQVRNRSIYVWGAQGQTGSTITEAWIRGREKGTGGYSSAESYADAAVKLWKRRIEEGFKPVLRAFDCSGLGMYFLYNLKKLYSGDLSANSLYGKCTLKLTRTTCRRGDMAFRGSTTKKTHVGYVVDRDGTVVEAQGRRAGVCTSNLQSKTGNGSYYWEYFARPDIFRKEIEADTGTTSPTTRQVEVVGASVNVRRVDSSTADIAFIAKRGEKFPFKGTAPSGWHIISTKACEMLFISNRTDLTKIV